MRKYKCLYCRPGGEKSYACENYCTNGLVTLKVQKKQKEFIKWCEGMQEYRKKTSLWS